MTEESAEVAKQDDESRSGRLGSALVQQLLKAVDEGIGPMAGARDYGDSRQRLTGEAELAIKRIIRETVAASGTAGLVTGVGGFLTLPVTLPANIAGQAVLNARMVAAIAHLRGWSLDDEVVRQSVLITVAGGSPNQVLRQFGITLGQKLTETAIKRVPIALIREINKRVGFMLIAKYGTKRSVMTLSKGVPLIGGVVGGTVDATFARMVGTLAKRAFPAVGGGDQAPHDPADRVPV